MLYGLKYCLLTLLIFCSTILAGQYSKEINDAIKSYSTAKSDTERVKILNELSSYYRENDNTKALNLGLRALKLSDSLKFKRGYWYAFNNIGEAYRYLGVSKEALNYHQKALNYAEKNNKKRLIGHSYNNLAILVKNIGNLNLAKIYYEKSLNAYQLANDKEGLYLSYNNIGNLLYRQHNYKNAYRYLLLGYTIAKELKDSSIICQALSNIGNVLYEIEKPDSATFCYYKAYGISIKHASIREVLHAGSNLAYMYFEAGKFYQSKKLLDSLCLVAKKLKDKQELNSIFNYMSQMYYNWKKHELAYLYKDSAVKLDKELYNISNSQSINELNAVFENEKKELLIKNQSFEIASKERENRQKTIIIAIGTIALATTVFFAAMAFINFRRTKKANVIIEKQKLEAVSQKEIIEEKQKEILDSIHYAKRIQTAMLPSDKFIERKINNKN